MVLSRPTDASFQAEMSLSSTDYGFEDWPGKREEVTSLLKSVHDA